MRRSVAPLALGVAFSMVVAAACSSGSDDAATSPSSPPTTVGTTSAPPTGGGDGLTHLGLAATSIEPFDAVTMTGLTVTDTDATGAPVITVEPDVSGLEVWMTVAELPAIALNLMLNEDQTAVTTVIPMYPLAPFDGGDVEIQFADGDSRSAPITVSIAPLPRAPGAWDAAISEVLAGLDAHAAALQVDLADLAAADFADLSPDERVLKLAAGLMADGSAASLEHAADDFDADETELLDALTARLGLVASMPAPPAPIGGFAQPSGFSAPNTIGTRPAQQEPGGLNCTTFDLEINDAATLVQMIEKGRSSQIGWERQKLALDTAAVAEAASTISDAPTGPISPVAGEIAKVAAMLNLLFSGLNLWSAIDGGRYPTQLNSLTVELSTIAFNEDFVEDGRVVRADVAASSTGIDGAGLTTLIESIVKQAIDKFPTNDAIEPAVTGPLADIIGKGLDQAAETAAGRFIARLGDTFTDWCPQVWTVPIADADYLELRAALGQLSVDDPGLEYRPTEVGNDLLTVSVRPENFRGLSVYAQSPIDTSRLGVIATPLRILTRPGQIHNVNAGPVNADTTTMYWDAGAGSWIDGIGDDTNGEAIRQLVTPMSPGAYPFNVTIWSTSETGLRSVGWQTDPRMQTIEVDLVDFIVEPDPGHVLIEQQLGFTAVDYNGRPVEVTWRATGGQIDQNGVYTAGKEPGTYTVTATLKDDPSISVTVNVIVTDAPCLVGTWQITHENFARLFADQLTITPAGGSWTITIHDDLTFVSRLDGFAFGMTMQGFTSRVVVNGEQHGQVHVNDTHFTSVDTFSHSVVVSVETPAGNITASDVGGVGMDFGGGAYRCEGGVLHVERDGYDFLYERID